MHWFSWEPTLNLYTNSRVLRQSLKVLKKSPIKISPCATLVIDGYLRTSGFLVVILRCGNTINLIWKWCGIKITAAWRIRQISWWMNERNSQNEGGKHVCDGITQFLLLCGEMETAVMCNMLMRNASIFQRQLQKTQNAAALFTWVAAKYVSNEKEL
jgi:hypothetical protein